MTLNKTLLIIWFTCNRHFSYLVRKLNRNSSAVIKAFTETSDWLLSQKISPPPVTMDNHYLCTVALRGHSQLVKPLRYGIRHKIKIVVNRQLCVANAFEQIIQERIPKGHSLIRSIYDKYGYPSVKTYYSFSQRRYYLSSNEAVGMVLRDGYLSGG